MPAPNTLKQKKRVDPNAPVPLTFPHEGQFLQQLGVPQTHPACRSAYSHAFNLEKHIRDLEAGESEPILIFELPDHLMFAREEAEWADLGGLPQSFFPGTPIDLDACLYLIADGVQRALAAYLLGRDLRVLLIQPQQGLEILRARETVLTHQEGRDLGYLRGRVMALLEDASASPLPAVMRSRILGQNLPITTARKLVANYNAWQKVGLAPSEAGINEWSLPDMRCAIRSKLAANERLTSREEFWPQGSVADLPGYLLTEIVQGIAQSTRQLPDYPEAPLRAGTAVEITSKVLAHLESCADIYAADPRPMEVRELARQATLSCVFGSLPKALQAFYCSGVIDRTALTILNLQPPKVLKNLVAALEAESHPVPIDRLRILVRSARRHAREGR